MMDNGPESFSPSNSPAAAALAEDSHHRWLVLLNSFVILTLGFSFGLFSLPVFYPVLARTFQWNHADVAAGGSIVLLLIGGAAPLIGWLIDSYSARAVLLGGMCLVGIALLLLATTRTLAQYYGFCTLLGLGISAVSILPASLLVAPWFAKKGIAVGVINAGIGLGGFIAPMLTVALIAQWGTSGAFLFLASLLVIPLVLTLLVKNKSPRRAGKQAQAAAGAGRQTVSATAVNRANFWLLGLSLFFAAHAMLAVQQHLVLYLTGQGVSAKSAALLLSVALGASAVGKVLSGAVSDAYSARAALVLSVLCIGIGIAALLVAGSAVNLLYIIIFGLGYGGIFNAPPTLSFELFGVERIGRKFGVMLLFFGAGTSTGGLLAGSIYDHTHRYSSAFAFDLAVAAAALVLPLFAKRNSRIPLAQSAVPE